jgi:hypothetical protein
VWSSHTQAGALHVAPHDTRALDQQRVAGGVDDGPVELDVAADHLGEGAVGERLVARGDDLVGVTQPLVGAPGRREACRLPVEQGTQLVEVADEVGLERGHLEAAASELADQPLVAQQEQRLLDRLAGHIEPFGQLLLAQGRPGSELPGADVVDDRLEDLVGPRRQLR